MCLCVRMRVYEQWMAPSLFQAGYKNVWNVEGSLFKWVNEGGSVWNESQELPKPAVHPMGNPWAGLLNNNVERKYPPSA